MYISIKKEKMWMDLKVFVPPYTSDYSLIQSRPRTNLLKVRVEEINNLRSINTRDTESKGKRFTFIITKDRVCQKHPQSNTIIHFSDHL